MTTSPAATSAPREETRIGPYTLRIWSPIERVPNHLKKGYCGTGTITSAQGEWIIDDATHLLPLPAADVTGDGQPEAIIEVRNGACWDPARGVTNPDMFWHAVDSFRLTR